MCDTMYRGLEVTLLCSAYNACGLISTRHKIIRFILAATGIPGKIGAFLSQWKTVKTIDSSNS